MAAFFDSRGVLCYTSEWRRILIAGVFSAIYPSGSVFDSRGVLCYNIRVAADSRGVLCYISEWRRILIAGVFSATISEWWLIAGVFSAIYPSGSVF